MDEIILKLHYWLIGAELVKKVQVHYLAGREGNFGEYEYQFSPQKTYLPYPSI